MTTCTAAVAHGPHADFVLEELTVQEPQAGEVRVKVAGVGLCHTDLVFRDQVTSYPFPAVFGHEGAGVIDAIGEGVDGFAIGDRVIVGFSSCGACPRCEEALPSYCRSFVPLNYAGMRVTDGSRAYAKGDTPVASHFFGQSTFATHAITRARNLVKVEDSAAPLEMLGTLACGFQTGAGAIMRTFACPAGSTLVVFGGGPVGLAAVMAAKIRGCSRIILVEPMAGRREIGLELGATDVIDPATGDLAAAIRSLVPEGVDFAFDTTGNVSVIEAGMASLGSHGAIGLVGVPRDAGASITVNINALMTPGHRIYGIIEGDSDQQGFIPELIAHHAAGRFPFDRLVRTYPMREINEAISAQAQGECIKVVLIP
ncbi:NAD(P)-dependent alcohol dehydrogenase [Sphingomonas mucosissima]|uniref:Aryl-alcohol dehydrogenase n=1 Tax=Sphingomonas mucosissima TaxID=370959 RepID=A0A245ZL99_9SPHN|nr:NAD(P)-dependent alcohol dehydrogenase [Sphingomonas mucosissima]OWK30519.1 aryl-alcohol dehydrogenase [Sphingomonas mucosissima]